MIFPGPTSTSSQCAQLSPNERIAAPAMADMQPGKRPPSMTIGNSTASATRSSTVLKRTSTAHPKPSSLAIDPSTLIAQHAVLTGTHPIAIGSDVVLHPHSKVSSTYAPVTLRDGVVVFERAHVGVLAVPTPPSHGQYGLVLDKYVVIETGAVVEAAEVGQGTVVEVGAKLGLGCVIGKVCGTSLHTHVGLFFLRRLSFSFCLNPSCSSVFCLCFNATPD